MSTPRKPDHPADAVPEPTLRRLPSYIHLLKLLEMGGRAAVSTTHIARELRLDPTQVRKDLSYTGIAGKPRVGYDVGELIDAIERFLGWSNTTEAFLVGAGHLGTALLGYERLAEYGVRVVAAFDNDPERIGQTIHGREVLDVDRMVGLARRMHVHLGILTVPGPAAQRVAAQMEAAGIRAIWNFAPAALDVGERVIVQNEQLYATLAVLSRRLHTSLEQDHTARMELARNEQHRAPAQRRLHP